MASCACMSKNEYFPPLVFVIFLTESQTDVLAFHPPAILTFFFFTFYTILILQGGETDIHAKFYSMAFQQNYDEDDGTVTWKIVDYQFAGDIPYF